MKAYLVNGVLYVFFDGGNTDIKAMIFDQWNDEIVMPHSVWMPNEEEYALQVRTHKGSPTSLVGTSIFKARGQGYVVGVHATEHIESVRKLGADKYTRDHFGAMFEAAMLQMYPQSCENVKVIVLHPSDITEENLNNLKRSIGGKHKLELTNGEKIEYNVTEVFPQQEPIAALNTFLLTQEGDQYKTPGISLIPGTKFLVIDVGGGLTGFIPCEITRNGDIETNTVNPPVIEAGIQNVISKFKRELRNSQNPNIRKAFGNQTSFGDDRILSDALMRGVIRISGDTYNCEEEVKNAMGAISQLILDVYDKRYKGGTQFDAIVISGGGGAIAFKYLKDYILRHKYIYPAEISEEKQRWGGVRGACKGFKVFLAQGRG